MSRILIIISIITLFILLVFYRVQNFSSSDYGSSPDERLEDYLKSQFSRWSFMSLDTEIVIDSNDGEYATGRVGGNGAKWFAVKRGGKWILLASGINLKSCEGVRQMNIRYQLKDGFIPCSEDK